jgi:hypothetical protein
MGLSKQLLAEQLSFESLGAGVCTCVCACKVKLSENRLWQGSSPLRAGVQVCVCVCISMCMRACVSVCAWQCELRRVHAALACAAGAIANMILLVCHYWFYSKF